MKRCQYEVGFGKLLMKSRIIEANSKQEAVNLYWGKVIQKNPVEKIFYQGQKGRVKAKELNCARRK